MVTNRDTVSKEVISLIAEQLNKPAATVKEEDSFEKLGADSLDRVELVMKLEEHFGLEVSDEEAESFHTVSQIIDYVKAQKSKE